MAPADTTVDAHTHVASSDEHRYPRQPTGAGSSWWQRPSGIEELVAELDASGVGRAVVVQAVGVYGYDCDYAADSAATDDRFAFVGALDMSRDDVGAAFDQLEATTQLAGLRLFGVGAAGAGWLSSPAATTVWERADRAGCVLVPTIFGDALPALGRLMRQYPDVDVALDHCAFPDLAGPDAMAQLCGLAGLDRLHLKVTSHNLDRDDPAPFLETLVDAFGPARVCWGSDHPQHHTRTYPELLELALAAARNLSTADREAFLGGNAARLWWPPADAAPQVPAGRDAPGPRSFRAR